MDIANVLIELASAAVIAVPLTARAYAKRADAAMKTADASKLGAEAEKTIADAVGKAVATLEGTIEGLTARLAETERKHAVCEKTLATQRLEIDNFTRQSASDADLTARLAEQVEKSEGIIRGLRNQVTELDRIVKTGRLEAS